MKYVLSASAANKVRELISATPGVSRRTVATSGAGIVDDYAPPFTVQYAASIDSGSGGWIVWLPAGSININGTEVVPTDSGGTALAAAGTPYPANWYKLPVTTPEASEGEEEEEEVSPSVFYLALYFRTAAGAATTPLARISDTLPVAADYPTGYGAPRVVRICTISGKVVMQRLAGAVVIDAADSSGGGGNTTYPDEISISDNDSDTSIDSGIFSLKGFGRFTYGGNQIGSYTAPSTITIGKTATGVAAVCRVGNVSAVDGNSLAYCKLKIEDDLVPASPFEYSVNTSGESVVRSITHNTFYFNGALQTVADFSAVPADGTVYLVCTGTTTESGALAWAFTIATAPGAAPEGGKVLNIKLYDFASGKIQMDYRTTFLTLAEPIGFGEKTFTFDDVDVAKILADDDIDVGQKTLAAGSGISLAVSADGKTITISATGASGSTSGYTGSRTVLADVDYDSESFSLRRKYFTETWSNGVLTASTEGAWETYHTAVEETV